MIHIDISGVPPDRWEHPNFLQLRLQMETALSQRAWINAFCIHEAGHMTYCRELGVTDYDFLGPRISYDRGGDSFDGYMAAVQPKGIPRPYPDASDTQKILNTVAKACVAGLVFTRTLTSAPDSGEAEDRQRFHDLCRVAEGNLSGASDTVIDRKKSWEIAEKEVLVDLRSPQFRLKAWETARAIEDWLFRS